MAAQNENIFEELAPYARLTVIPGVSVGQLNYVNQQDLTYTCVLPVTAGAVPANSILQFFQGTLGDAATTAGYSAGTLSLSQTSSRFPRGQAPANQAFVSVSTGFTINQLDTNDLTATPKASLVPFADDLYALAHNFSWDLTIGRGITRTIGTLASYCGPEAVYAIQNDAEAPDAGDFYGSNTLGKPGMGFTKLKVPIVFPPLINVSITAQNGSPFTLLDAIAQTTRYYQFKITLRGYLMTMPVG